MQQKRISRFLSYLMIVLMISGMVQVGGFESHAMGDTFYGGISGGVSHSTYVLSDGTVLSAGSNQYGQLGTGNTYNQNALISTPTLSHVKQVSGGMYHTVFLMEDGTVKAVGSNNRGQLGDGTNTDKSTPITVPGLSGVKQVSSGWYHTIYLMKDGTVKGVGSNSNGELGIGNATHQNIPIEIPTITSVKQVSSGRHHTVFLMEDGTIKVTGWNNYGQLGIDNIDTQHTPIQVHGIENVEQVSSGLYHSVFLMKDGTVKATGYNRYGQLGIGSDVDSLTPVTIPGLSNVVQVSCGAQHTLFLLEDRTVKATGFNSQGQLGIHSSHHLSPVFVSELTNVEQVIGVYFHSVFLMKDSTVKVTGRNTDGQLGIGNFTNQNTPLELPISHIVSLFEGSWDSDTSVSVEITEATLLVEQLETAPTLEKANDALIKLTNVEPGETKDDLYQRIVTQVVAIAESTLQTATTTEEIETLEFFFASHPTLYDSAPELETTIQQAKEALQAPPLNPSTKEAKRFVALAEITQREPHIQNAIDAVATLELGVDKDNLEARLLQLQQSSISSLTQRQVERFVKMAEITGRDLHIGRANQFIEPLPSNEEKTAFTVRIESIEEPPTPERLDEMKATQAVEQAEKHKQSFLIRRASQLVSQIPDSETKTILQLRVSQLQN